MMDLMITTNDESVRHVKFISFETNIPRCYQFQQYVLTLEIDGEVVKFGNDFAESYDDFIKNENYRTFWKIYPGGMHIYYDLIPDQYKKYMWEILEIFSSKIQYLIKFEILKYNNNSKKYGGLPRDLWAYERYV